MIHFRYKQKQIAIYICFGLCVLFLFYKCRFGFGNLDESFYLTVPYRLCQGDGLFLHEWNQAQMTGVLLYPFMKLFLTIAGSTDGVLLFFRVLYTVVHIMTGLFLFHVLKKENESAAFAVALIYMLYAPFGLMALSYNSMGLGSLLLAVTLLWKEKPGRGRLIMSGGFYACSVLCCPYLAACYFLCLASLIVSPKKLVGLRILNRRGDFLWWTMGITLIAIMFSAFVLSRMTFKQLLAVLPYILQDPDHSVRVSGQAFFLYFKAIILQNRVITGTYITSAALFLFFLFDRNREKNKTWCFSVVTLLVFLQMFVYLRDEFTLYGTTTRRCLNFLNFPLCLYCPFFALYLQEEATKALRLYVIPGIIYSFCIFLASDQAIYNIASAAILVEIGVLLMFFRILRRCIRENRQTCLMRWTVGLAVAGVVFAVGKVRYETVFWDAPMSCQTELITEGPERGLIVTEEKKCLYDDYNRDVNEHLKQGSVLFFSEKTWLYLLAERTFASCSAWLTSQPGEATMQKLRQYYEINPDKFPDQIYCELDLKEYAEALLVDIPFTSSTTELGNILYRVNK